MPVVDVGVDTTGELGMAPGESASVAGMTLLFHCRPSTGRYVFTFSPIHDKKAPLIPVVPGSGVPLFGSYTSKAILCSWETGSPHTSPGVQ